MTSKKPQLKGLSFEQIIENPDLLRQITCKDGQDLTYTEQVAKLRQIIGNPRTGRARPDQWDKQA